ncbi:alpha/beta hydrolase [Siccirubricoccus sp. KC 17139]|uniref:Alpha/beta hydrolase n=1 Tax=Siccirubricoccus soli TaxID=2899147 RepID=A0ABT1D9E5_9PROT|nr:alpha/beta hydrolase [Siccirubricoccus soli]MCO6418552.1 alpha/beta hydrolase [Siccirubricoccus soli]MCP2684687.1 alpha/beta hydrolase [Siccirubricoccus soli]
MNERDEALAEALSGYRLLLCYGLLGELMVRLRVDYMAGQFTWLRGLGAAVEVVPLPTAAPVEENADRIAAALLAGERPAILVGHSKGGLEALAALLRPGAAGACRGFVALQSPFHGSPVADAVCQQKPLHLAAHHALKALGLGSGEGVMDLTTARRGGWMAAHAAAIGRLAGALPMLSIATVLQAAEDWQDNIYLPVARWMERQGAGPNDGLVPVASTQLPGARHVVLAGGHRALVTEGPGRDPIGVLRGALAEVLGTPEDWGLCPQTPTGDRTWPRTPV